MPENTTEARPEAPPRFAAKNVVEALLAVMGDLPGIGKDEHASAQQGGYAYRGIEAITAAAQPLFAKHGVLFTPHRIVEWEKVDIVVGNRPWTDDRLKVLYRVYGPGGRDDYIDVEVPGIGRDNSDKGSNKAMTQAFKYALIQALCISDPRDDNDGTTAERDSDGHGGSQRGSERTRSDEDQRPLWERNGWDTEEDMVAGHKRLVDAAKRLHPDDQAALKEWVKAQWDGNVTVSGAFGKPVVDAILGRVAELLAERVEADNTAEPPVEDAFKEAKAGADAALAQREAESAARDAAGIIFDGFEEEDLAAVQALEDSQVPAAEAIEAEVAALSPRQVEEELVARGLPLVGLVKDRRQRLVRRYVRERLAGR